jgi:hypothetical protein
MPKYLLSVYGPAERAPYGNYPSKEAMLQAFADTGAFNDTLVADGYFVYADGLAEAVTATVVDGQGDEPVITDGPYLEAKEHLGGFWIIEAPDLDVALRLAAEGSKACRGKVEVRPFQTEDSIRELLDS